MHVLPATRVPLLKAAIVADVALFSWLALTPALEAFAFPSLVDWRRSAVSTAFYVIPAIGLLLLNIYARGFVLLLLWLMLIMVPLKLWVGVQHPDLSYATSNVVAGVVAALTLPVLHKYKAEFVRTFRVAL
jgi:hypothetical protein